MLTLLSVVLALFPLIALTLSYTENIERKIVHGQTAALGQFPYTVFLSLEQGTHCTGTVISKQCILTAGHCLKRPNFIANESIMVVAAANWRTEGYPFFFDWTNFHVHPQYDENARGKNDLAIIKYDGHFRFGNLFNYAPILENVSYIFTDKRVRIAGWGDTEDNKADVQETLQWADLKLQSDKTCEWVWPTWFKRGANLCGRTCNCAARSSACHGDSGSGLILIDEEFKKKPVLVGVTSSVLGKCSDAMSNLFMRVSDSIKWIREVCPDTPHLDMR